MTQSMTADPWLRPGWLAPARVRSVVTTRLIRGESRPPFEAFNLGAHCGDATAAVNSNRDAIVALLALPAQPRWLRQMHGDGVAVFDDNAPMSVEPRDADAAITRTAGVVLCVLTADCLPLLVCADDGSEVAAIHAGWRGLAAGVIERCVEKMHTPVERLMFWLGPAIAATSYEVGAEVRDAFVGADGATATAFVATRPGHWHCDLYALARGRLAVLGARRVDGGEFDTRTDARFYSYRGAGRCGRFASLVWIAA